MQILNGVAQHVAHCVDSPVLLILPGLDRVITLDYSGIMAKIEG